MRDVREHLRWNNGTAPQGWLEDVTDEAITAVMGHFITEMMRDNKAEIQKAWEVRGGKTLKVTFELVQPDSKEGDSGA